MTKSIPWIIALTGALVLFGWGFRIEVLKSVITGSVTMKISTALCFMIVGLSHAFLINKGGWREWVSMTGFMAVAAIMGISLFCSVFGHANPFDHAEDGFDMSSHPGRPSIGTMVAFMSVVISGVTWELKQYRVSVSCGRMVMGLGFLSFLGYATNTPGLYFYLADKSSAMALHTALLFVLLGFFITWRSGKSLTGN